MERRRGRSRRARELGVIEGETAQAEQTKAQGKDPGLTAGVFFARLPRFTVAVRRIRLAPPPKKSPGARPGHRKFGELGPLPPTSGGPEMSIHIASTAEWFRCIGPAATRQEHHAALAKPVRMLVGDSTRLRPPISLPGRPAMLTAPPPAAALRVKLRSYRQALPQGKVISSPSRDSDARESYSRRRLKHMDRKFVKRLEHAIARGEERPPCSISC
jgi:hypothetical protein